MVLLVLTVPVMMGAGDLSESIKLDAELQSENPYVQAYIRERGRVAEEDSLLNNSEQRASDIELMKEFYADDIKVAGVIQKYQSVTKSMNMVEKATSLDKDTISGLLDRVVDIYDTATEEEQELLLAYMLRYVRECGNERSTAFFENLTNNSTAAAVSYTYNDNLSSSYAVTWAYGHNTAYPHLGTLSGDCTNFVSQCLEAGGILMRNTWYCHKRNNTYLVPATIDQLNNSWKLEDPSPWISIKTFTSFWASRVKRVDYYTMQYYKINYKSIYNTSISKGDVVVFHSGVANVLTIDKHAMIISAVNSVTKDFLVSGHTENRKNVSLIGLMQNDYGYCSLAFYDF